MSFRRDSLADLTNRIQAKYASLFRPLDRTPRHSLLKVFAAVDAGIYHQLLGDLDFLSLQIFPDTAEGEFLRRHWSMQVPPLHAVSASGEAEATGTPGRPIPAGVVFAAASGERYYPERSFRLDAEGKAAVAVKAQNPGSRANLAAGERLSIVSSIPAGVDSEATVVAPGITVGADAETDEEYLVRVLAHLRNPSRYGRRGDFALWAMEASAQVSAAWEFRNFGVFGAVLIQTINGTQAEGVHPVDNLAQVRGHIETAAPPVIFEVRSPAVVRVNPSAALLPGEDSLANRELAESRMTAWMQLAAMPGAQITAGALRLAAIDGVDITECTVRIGGSPAGTVETTIMEYPAIGSVSWE